MIRDRIRAIASGDVPDNTSGANSFRAEWYRGRWYQRIDRFGKNIGGNIFGYEPKIPNGPYAPYKSLKDTGELHRPRSPRTVANASPQRLSAGSTEVGAMAPALSATAESAWAIP